LDLSVLGSRVCPFRITWHHRSRVHPTCRRLFPIGGLLESSVYLKRFPRYSMANV